MKGRVLVVAHDAAGDFRGFAQGFPEVESTALEGMNLPPAPRVPKVRIKGEAMEAMMKRLAGRKP